MADTIKDYLVALGFDVNMSSYNKMQGVLKELDSKVKISTSEMATNYVKAGSAIVSTFITIGAAAVDLVDKIARADLGYQKFAMRMYMTKNAAREMKIVTDAMGDSLDDIAWTPLLQQRYQSLMETARAMEVPGGPEGQLKYIHDIRTEFLRLKVEATFGLQHIAVSLVKHLVGPLSETRMSLRDINYYIQKKMPEWADKVAKFLANLFQLASHALIPIRAFFGVLKDLFTALPDWGRQLVIFGGIFLAIFVSGPIGRAMIIIGSFILLWDDFWVHVRGGEGDPTLGPIWDALIEKVYWLESHIVKLSYYFGNFWADLRKNGWLAGPLNGLLDPNKPNRMDKGVEEKWAEWKKNNPAPTPGSPGRPATYKGREIGGENTNIPISDIIQQARRVSLATGIPVENIFGHWYHETGGFKNRGARQLNNLAGINVPGGKGQDYKNYGSLDEFGSDYIWLMKNRYSNVRSARTPEEYMSELRKKGYFTGPLGDAQRGAAAGARKMKEYSGVSYLEGTPVYQVPLYGQGGAISGNGDTVNNNFNISLYGKDSDQQVREVEKIIQKYNSKEASVYNRFPAVGGVTP